MMSRGIYLRGGVSRSRRAWRQRLAIPRLPLPVYVYHGHCAIQALDVGGHAVEFVACACSAQEVTHHFTFRSRCSCCQGDTDGRPWRLCETCRRGHQRALHNLQKENKQRGSEISALNAKNAALKAKVAALAGLVERAWHVLPRGNSFRGSVIESKLRAILAEPTPPAETRTPPQTPQSAEGTSPEAGRPPQDLPAAEPQGPSP